jgi:hypothetical protein
MLTMPAIGSQAKDVNGGNSRGTLNSIAFGCADPEQRGVPQIS